LLLLTVRFVPCCLLGTQKERERSWNVQWLILRWKLNANSCSFAVAARLTVMPAPPPWPDQAAGAMRLGVARRQTSKLADGPALCFRRRVILLVPHPIGQYYRQLDAGLAVCNVLSQRDAERPRLQYGVMVLAHGSCVIERSIRCLFESGNCCVEHCMRLRARASRACASCGISMTGETDCHRACMVCSACC